MIATSFERLAFRLHRFKRMSWTSAAARDRWEPELRMLEAAVNRSHEHAVRAGSITSATIVRPTDALRQIREMRSAARKAKVLGPLQASPFTSLGAITSDNAELVVMVAGDDDRVDQASDAWASADHKAWLDATGWPSCCATRQAEINADGWQDPTFPLALKTDLHSNGLVTFKSRWQTNHLLRRLGLAATPHLPCSSSCIASVALAEEMRDIMRDESGPGACELLMNVLSWPVEWSTLHGIAELKTPVFRLVCDTDAVATKLVIRSTGDVYPAESATGLLFPYRAPRYLALSESRGFQQGIDNPIE